MANFLLSLLLIVTLCLIVLALASGERETPEQKDLRELEECMNSAEAFEAFINSLSSGIGYEPPC